MSFDDLYKQLCAIDKKQRGDAFEELCRTYLKSRFAAVWHWRERPPSSVTFPADCTLNGRDTGIDFYAGDGQGNLWAIQAKGFCGGQSLYKKDIDSFIADTTVRKIEKRIVITTASKMSRHAVRYTKELSCEAVLLQDLKNANVTWPEQLITRPPRSTQRKKSPSLAESGWLPYEQAREYARALRLRNHQAWLTFVRTRKKRPDVPANPSVTYKSVWQGWGDFLGTGNNRTKQWRDFASAHKWVLNLKIANEAGWREFTKSLRGPEDIPTNPDRAYRGSGWVSWPHWLRGKDKPMRASFEEARDWARSSGLRDNKAWREAAKREELPPQIPRSPQSVYKGKGWQGWGDFLGTGAVSPAISKSFVDFKEARDIVRKLGLRSAKQWRDLSSDKRPSNVPRNPDRHYKGNGWTNWGDFLGTNRIATRNLQRLPFKKARSLVRKLHLTSREQWYRCRAVPNGIPRNPDQSYKEWQGWPDWLGYRLPPVAGGRSSG